MFVLFIREDDVAAEIANLDLDGKATDVTNGNTDDIPQPKQKQKKKDKVN